MTAINLIATIPARAETADVVRELLQEYAAHVVTMEGSDRFEVYTDRDNPAVIVVVEQYRDKAAFDLHINDPENAVLNDKLAELTEGGSQLQFLTSA